MTLKDNIVQLSVSNAASRHKIEVNDLRRESEVLSGTIENLKQETTHKNERIQCLELKLQDRTQNFSCDLRIREEQIDDCNYALKQESIAGEALVQFTVETLYSIVQSLTTNETFAISRGGIIDVAFTAQLPEDLRIKRGDIQTLIQTKQKNYCRRILQSAQDRDSLLRDLRQGMIASHAYIESLFQKYQVEAATHVARMEEINRQLQMQMRREQESLQQQFLVSLKDKEDRILVHQKEIAEAARQRAQLIQEKDGLRRLCEENAKGLREADQQYQSLTRENKFLRFDVDKVRD
jgi:hypothetical protein